MLRLEIVWVDPDLIEIDITASSDGFAGRARVYFTEELLQQLAEKLTGFPSSPADVREFSTQNFEGGNSFKIRCYSIDSIGHGIAEIEIVEAEDQQERAVIRLPVVASDLDSFTSHLRRIAADRAGLAVLGSFQETGAA